MNKRIFLPVSLAVVFMLAVVSSAHADPKDYSGIWVLKLGQRNLLVLHLVVDGNDVKGTVDRPEKFSATNSLFMNISNAVRTDKVVQARFVNGALHLETQ